MHYPDPGIGGVAETAECAEKFAREKVGHHSQLRRCLVLWQ